MILFENVTKKYRGTQKPALDGIDLRVDRGEFVFIVGASGSGKSSCLRLILREDLQSSGKIHVLGQDLSKISSRKVPYFRRNLGTVFQDFRLLQNKTVYDNVAFTLQVIGKSRGFIQEAVPDTLEMVGLANKAKRFPHELSGGEQQRVAIARAIVNKPAILLADEPTGNLDPATSLGIMQLLRSINAAGTTVVMATHEATFVDIMQQRVVELSQGIVVRDEVGGGYGETASIPMADLTAEGVQVLRTTEAVVRAALAPADAIAASESDAAEGDLGAGSPTSVPGPQPELSKSQLKAAAKAEAKAAAKAQAQATVEAKAQSKLDAKAAAAAAKAAKAAKKGRARGVVAVDTIAADQGQVSAVTTAPVAAPAAATEAAATTPAEPAAIPAPAAQPFEQHNEQSAEPATSVLHDGAETLPDAPAPAAVRLPEPVPSVPTREASVYSEPTPFGTMDVEMDDDFTDTHKVGPQGKRIPSFLDPDRPMDAVRMSETGSLAEHLGLSDNDDETDVGPVR